MMPIVKKFFEKIKQVNKEYLLLFAVFVLIGLLIYSNTATSQGTPEEMVLTTMYPCPFGEFVEVRATRFYDFDDVNYWLDPNGESQFLALRIFDGIFVQNAVSGPGATVNFGTGAADLGAVYASVLRMDSAGPALGKYVFDIAEGMEMTGCEIGDVVIIGDDPDKGLIKSNKKFDPLIAGIVSSDPKIYMGPGENKLPLALAGIVKCNATAENGAIKRGDLLVSSSMAGYAMRASAKEVKPGMVIGKALQSLESGRDKIFVLVNKQ